jgi:thiol-disulfide isomerase/thioredoxin
MKQLFFITFSTLLFLQAGAQGQFVINGILPDDSYNGKMVYLKAVSQVIPEEELVTIDSVTVVQNAFQLKGAVTQSPKPAFVVFNPQQASIFLLEPGAITFQSGSISGTPANEKFQAFHKKLMSMPDSELNPVVYDYVKENMSNTVGEYLITKLATLLKPAQAAELVRLARPEFQQHLAKNPLYSPSVGDKYIDVKLESLEGKEVSISDYVGKSKYVLIDFWASWCGPCIRENPTLLEAYEKYRAKGFEIVGLSLDNNKDKWAQAVKRLGITWQQLSDLGGANSLAARLYKIQSIPASFLLNQDGVVIAKNLRGSELLDTLETLLGK